ncbi:methyltransferase [Escherichia coli]|uniref:Methyltransferase n=1 Tax=Escherichia coli TaxID=562 RepID=A0A377BVU0_ECOLX|nr:methyltransferase [Escherichia coli]
MNDEMKGKSGKVKVMYVRSDDDSDKRTHNPRTGKGGGRPGKSRADGGRRPARDDKQSQPRDRKWEDSPWRTVSRAPGDERRKRPITVASVVKVLLIQKFCVVSVRKKPASTAKMHVRHCSRAVRKRLFAPGLSRA